MKIQWRSFLMKILFAVTNIVYLNVLWFLFSFLGLFIFGFAPASVALVKSLDGFHLEQDYIPIKKFYSFYKGSFKKANILQMSYLLVISLLLLSYRILIVVMNVSGFIPVFYITIVLLLILMNIISLLTMIKFPSMTFLERFKLSLFLLMRYPFQYLPIVFTIIGCYYIISMKSSFSLFLGISLPLAVIAYLHQNIQQKFSNDFPEFGVF